MTLVDWNQGDAKVQRFLLSQSTCCCVTKVVEDQVRSQRAQDKSGANIKMSNLRSLWICVNSATLHGEHRFDEMHECINEVVPKCGVSGGACKSSLKEANSRMPFSDICKGGGAAEWHTITLKGSYASIGDVFYSRRCWKMDDWHSGAALWLGCFLSSNSCWSKSLATKIAFCP